MARPFAVPLAALCLSLVARASPTDDVTRGTNLYMSGASVSLSGTPYATGGVSIPKDPGTLDMTLNARTFGLGADVYVHLHGSATGGVITWTFSEHLPTPYPVDSLDSVTDIAGAIAVTAMPIPGSADARCNGATCPFNIQMLNGPGTWIHVSGSGPFFGYPTWGEDVTVNAVELLGGLPRPVLASFGVWVPQPRYCAATVWRQLVGSVAIGSPAPTGGAWVDMSSSDPVNAPVSSVFFPEGASVEPVILWIAPSYVGDVIVTAASGGAFESQSISVLPASSCLPFFTVKAVRLLFLPQWGGCVACGTGLDLNDAEAALLSINGLEELYSPQGGLTDLSKLLGGSGISATRLNDLGAFAGTWTAPDGTFQGFLRSSADPKAPTVSLGEMVPLALNDVGVVGGYSFAGNSPAATYYNGSTSVTLPVQGAWSYVTALNNFGALVGNYSTGKSQRAFYAYKGAVTDLGSLGGSTSVAAINASGWSTGASQTPSGAWSAFVAAPASTLTSIGNVKGFQNAQPTSINSAGWVVGTADNGSGQGTHGFIYSPAQGMVDLNSVLDPKLGAQVSQALKITDANEVWVSGQLNGVSGQFVLEFN